MLKSANTKTYKIQKEWRTGFGDNITDISLLLTLGIWFWPGLPAPDTALVTGSTGHTSALRGHQTLTGITYTITPVAALTARPPPVGICGAPEDWNICSKRVLQCCRTFTVKKYHNYVELLRLMSHLLYHQMIQPFSEYSGTLDSLICFKMPTYKSERSGGINLSETLQQIIIEGCYREVLQKPHNPVSENPSAFKDLAMQTHAAQVWRTGTHTIYHTLIRPLLWIKQRCMQFNLCTVYANM